MERVRACTFSSAASLRCTRSRSCPGPNASMTSRVPATIRERKKCMITHENAAERTAPPGRSLSDRAMKRVFPILLLIALLTPCMLRAAGNSPPKPDPGDRCPVCGMRVAGFPNWQCTVIFKDGFRAFFDGPKHMFKYVRDLKRYNPSRQPGDLAALFVTDYYELTPIDARKAWYIVGSDVRGSAPSPVHERQVLRHAHYHGGVKR